MKEKIGLANDHAGYDLKIRIVDHLIKLGFEIEDFGTLSPESVDYPDFAHILGEAVSVGKVKRGIVLCGSGNGVNITVNKHENVRSALCWIEEIARLARSHNDANILALPARFISTDDAIKIVDTFLNTTFEGGRHQSRVDKINISVKEGIRE